jgi:hypothetical protein
MNDEVRTTEPHDRLTRLCAAMTETLDAHPERGNEKCIVFLQEHGGEGARGGLTLHGYENDVEAMADLFMHLRAIFAANGKTLMLAPLHGGPDS